MNELVLDKEKILEYLQFLVSFSDELRDRNIVIQEDLERINREIDKFVSRLKKNKIPRDLALYLNRAKIPLERTSAARPKSLLYYLMFIFLFGWAFALIFAAERNRQDSLLRKEVLREFRGKIIHMIARIDDFKLKE